MVDPRIDSCKVVGSATVGSCKPFTEYLVQVTEGGGKLSWCRLRYSAFRAFHRSLRNRGLHLCAFPAPKRMFKNSGRVRRERESLLETFLEDVLKAVKSEVSHGVAAALIVQFLQQALVSPDLTTAGDASPADDYAAIIRRAEPEVGWGSHDESQMSDPLRRLRDVALQEFALQTQSAASSAQQAFLSSSTLAHYAALHGFDDVSRHTEPRRGRAPAVRFLVEAMVARGGQWRMLQAERPIQLAGSLRVVGWDAEGATILSWETPTQRAPLREYLDQFEYLLWLAIDLARPGRGGILITQFPDGYFYLPYYVNPAPLIAIARCLNSLARGHVKAAYFVGMPRAFEHALGLITKALDRELRNLIFCVPDEADVLRRLADTHGASRATCDRINTAFSNRLEHRRDPQRTPLQWDPIVDHPFFTEVCLSASHHHLHRPSSFRPSSYASYAEPHVRLHRAQTPPALHPRLAGAPKFHPSQILHPHQILRTQILLQIPPPPSTVPGAVGAETHARDAADLTGGAPTALRGRCTMARAAVGSEACCGHMSGRCGHS